MPVSSILLPTNAIYKSPTMEGFSEAKNALLEKQFGADYFVKDVDRRWNQLMEAFAAVAPVDDREKFIGFQAKRKNVEYGNKNVLQLFKALDYFEHFFFFYCDNNSKFKLSDLEKTMLRQEVNEAMAEGLCEPGLITRLENGMQKAKKDTNWIVNALHQQRRSIIEQIAVEYNRDNAVPESMSIHTVMHMQKQAQSKSLGIELEGEISDIYTDYFYQRAMSVYFESVYKGKFAQYPRYIVTSLSQYAMDELAEFLSAQGLNLNDWDANSIALTIAQQQALSPLIERLFDDNSLEPIGGLDDDTFNYSLFNRKEFYQAVDKLVQKKLVNGGFFVSLADIDKSKLSSYDLHLPSSVSLKALIEFNEAIQNLSDNFNDVRALFRRNLIIISQYPNLLVDKILENPALWLSLPKPVKNNVVLIDACIEKLNKLLADAVKKENNPRREELIDSLWMIVKSNTDFMQNVSKTLLADKNIALKLVAKDGLLLRMLPDVLKKDDVVMKAAIGQNRKAFYYTYNEQGNIPLLYEVHRNELPSELAVIFPISDLDNAQIAFDNFVKIQNMLVLLQQRHISSGRLTRLAQSLTPDELLKVIQVRRDNQLPMLPHCSEHNLQIFTQVVSGNLWRAKGYLAVKREITATFTDENEGVFLSDNYRNYIAKKCIVESNQWFLASMAFNKKFPAYDAAFNTFGDVFAQWLLSTQGLMALLQSVGSSLLKYTMQILPYLLLVVANWYTDPIIYAFIEKLVEFTIANIGMVLPLVFHVLVLSSLLYSLLNYLEIDDAPYLIGFGLCVVLFAVAFPAELLFIATYIELVSVSALMIAALIKLASSSMNVEISWFAAKLQAVIGCINYLTAEINFTVVLIKVVYQFAQDLFLIWPQMVVDALLPWLTRTWATLSKSREAAYTGDDAIKIDVEESISRLLNSEEPAAIKKGEILDALWEKTQSDVGEPQGAVSLARGLNKKYDVLVSSEVSKLSLWEVAAKPRSNALEFSISAPDSRFSFFGLRGDTATASQLRKHVDFSVPAAINNVA